MGNTQSAVPTSVVLTGLERAKCVFLYPCSLRSPTLRNPAVNVGRETISDLRRNRRLFTQNVAVYTLIESQPGSV